MPPTGFHGLIGLFIASQISKEHPKAKIAFIFGSVFPDIDIFGSILIFISGILQGLSTSQLEVSVISFHRSLTHNIFLIAGCILLGLVFMIKNPIMMSKEWGYAFIAMGLGIGTHVLLDFFYIDGISVLWPVIPYRIYPFPNLPTYNSFPDNVQRLLAASDSAFDGIYWIILGRIISTNFADAAIKIGKIRITNSGDRLQVLGVITLIGLFTFGLIGYFTDIFTRNVFVVILYIPGMFVLFLTCFSPFIFKRFVIDMPKFPQKWFSSKNTASIRERLY